jgi:hypothetical protein
MMVLTWRHARASYGGGPGPAKGLAPVKADSGTLVAADGPELSRRPRLMSLICPDAIVIGCVKLRNSAQIYEYASQVK